MAAVLIAYPALAIRYADLETALPEIIIILHVTKYENTAFNYKHSGTDILLNIKGAHTTMYVLMLRLDCATALSLKPYH